MVVPNQKSDQLWPPVFYPELLVESVQNMDGQFTGLVSERLLSNLGRALCLLKQIALPSCILRQVLTNCLLGKP